MKMDVSHYTRSVVFHLRQHFPMKVCTKMKVLSTHYIPNHSTLREVSGLGRTYSLYKKKDYLSFYILN